MGVLVSSRVTTLTSSVNNLNRTALTCGATLFSRRCTRIFFVLKGVANCCDVTRLRPRSPTICVSRGGWEVTWCCDVTSPRPPLTPITWSEEGEVEVMWIHGSVGDGVSWFAGKKTWSSWSRGEQTISLLLAPDLLLTYGKTDTLVKILKTQYCYSEIRYIWHYCM